MKNKSGFTLIELLAVIVIIAVVSGIATFSILRILRKNKQKALEAKEEVILKQARQYGLDNEETLFTNLDLLYGNYVCKVITVGDLVTAGYLDEDDKDVDGGSKDVINPVNGESMKNRKIMLYVKSSGNPNEKTYSSVEIYSGQIMSIFDNNRCVSPYNDGPGADLVFYDNYKTQVNCHDVQCMLDYIAGMIYD